MPFPILEFANILISVFKYVSALTVLLTRFERPYIFVAIGENIGALTVSLSLLELSLILPTIR